MSRCRHRRAAVYESAKLRRPLPVISQAARRHGFKAVCIDCKATLPLGPARDTAETAVECRAADIAADHEDRILSRWSSFEAGGRELYLDNGEPNADQWGADEWADFDAGWLAAAICMHKESDRG